MHFEGVIPAMLTPFDESGRLDSEALFATAGWLLDNGASGLVGTGTMGEAQSLSHSERREAIATLVSAADGRVTVTAGVSSETAATSIAYAEDAAAAGAGALMLLPSLGYGGDAREIEAFYRAVAESTDLPIMAYNNPKASGTDMPPALIAALAAIDGLVAIKECSGDARRLAELVNATEGFEVLVGGDDWALEGFAAGATGWVSGVANVVPADCVRLADLVAEGRLPEARELYQRLLPLSRLDMTPWLVQYFKGAMDAVGLAGGPTRPPRGPLAVDQRAVLDEAVAALGLPVAA